MLISLVGLLACGDDDGTVEPDASFDAGFDGGTDSGPEDAGFDSGPPDVGTDVGTDAGTDAGMDAGPPDTGPMMRRELYGVIGADLVSIDTTTGAATLVASMSENAFLITDGTVLYGVTARTTAPALVEIDPCTGVFTAAPTPITVAGATVFFMEGGTWDPDGDRIYMSASLDGAIPADPLSESLLAVDPTTAVGTRLATITNTNDGELDAMTVVDGVLYGTDAFVSSCTGSDGRRCTALYTLDTTTGVATSVNDITYHANPIFYDSEGGLLWSYNLHTPDDRNVITFDLTTGTTTAVGESHASDEFGGANISSLVFITHACPEE